MLKFQFFFFFLSFFLFFFGGWVGGEWGGGCKRIVCTLVRSNKLFLLTGVATTTDTKAPPISQAYLVTYINVFLLFSIRLMFYKVLCCMFTYLYHRNSFLLNNATSVSFLVLLHGNRWRCFSQCFTSSKS